MGGAEVVVDECKGGLIDDVCADEYVFGMLYFTLHDCCKCGVLDEDLACQTLGKDERDNWV